MSQPQYLQPCCRVWSLALLFVSLVCLGGCVQQSPMVALGLQPAIQAQSHTRLRFPAHTPVLIRFDSSQAPEAWAVAAHQGVALHFPKAQRQQTASHGLEWFVRWPYVEPPTVHLAKQVEPAQEAALGHSLTQAESMSMEGEQSAGKWYSLGGAKHRLVGVKRQLGQQLGKVTDRLPNPLFWRRGDAAAGESGSLPARVRGLAQVVVSDRNNGKILALADVQIDQSILLRLASEPRDQINPAQRHASNERQIAKAFAALASSLVASGDS